MAPELELGEYIFCALPSQGAEQAIAAAVGTFREREGWSAILPASVARNLGLGSGKLFRMIRLGIDSALDGVGLTSAVSSALTDVGIPCNVVAALHHDYLFVPAADADRAVQQLHLLSEDARAAR